MAHTQGPWSVKRNPVTVSVRDAAGNYITENIRRLPNQDANARLIASAPELLAALKEILYEDSDKTDEAKIASRLMAELAILKAEGR